MKIVFGLLLIGIGFVAGIWFIVSRVQKYFRDWTTP